VEYLGGCCSACGYDKCLNALEFHHINPDEKEFSISKSSSLTLDAIKSELDKCVLLCSNCHREVHNSD
jgi:5-methylcytosine-specific restriction endonuclease McrA